MARKKKEKALRQAAKRVAAQQAEEMAEASPSLPVVVVSAAGANVIDLTPSPSNTSQPDVTPSPTKPAV